MERTVYRQGGGIVLAEYLAGDGYADYCDWNDEDTQRAYNFTFDETYEEFQREPPAQSRLYAVILAADIPEPVGILMLSKEDLPPDLAICIFRPYRGKGYGTAAFRLGVAYCFDVLKLDAIYAGCYLDNTASLSMLKRCGFVPHPVDDSIERHYLTGGGRIQLGFVRYNPFVSSGMQARR